MPLNSKFFFGTNRSGKKKVFAINLPVTSSLLYELAMTLMSQCLSWCPFCFIFFTNCCYHVN